MAVQPLSPATDRRLGGPLPRQLSNQTRAHPSAIKSLVSGRCLPDTLCGISSSFPLLSPSEGQVAHVLLTRPPLTRGASSPRPFDLHVLGTPPAFVLSQDQTLKKLYLKPFGLKPFFKCCSWHHSNSFPCAILSYRAHLVRSLGFCIV